MKKTFEEWQEYVRSTRSISIFNLQDILDDWKEDTKNRDGKVVNVVLDYFEHAIKRPVFTGIENKQGQSLSVDEIDYEDLKLIKITGRYINENG